jgi:putative transposase
MRRKAVAQLRTQTDLSQRRACRVVEQPRSTERYRPRDNDFERRLVERMHELVRAHPRYGYRHIWSLLRGQGWRVNVKRIHRLWRKEGLKVPRHQHKRRRLGSSANGCVRRRAERPNHVWAWDFFHDRTSDGRVLKWFSIIDEYTRENLVLEVRRRIGSGAVVEIFRDLFDKRAVPQHIRSDNGPEFIAKALRAELEDNKIGPLYIEPGAPWENGYAESFGSRLRDELLNAEEFTTLLEARVVGADWHHDYNNKRPHSALGYQTPAAFAAQCQAVEMPS